MTYVVPKPDPPIMSGVLFTRNGDVHESDPHLGLTRCAIVLPKVTVPVSAVQALVHKLPLCGSCYPPYTTRPGRG